MPPQFVPDLLIILGSGLVAGLVCRWLRVSVLVGYLVSGAIIGKGFLGWVSDEHQDIEMLAEIGVFLLLFSIGLEFSLGELWRLGRQLVIGGAAQMLLVALPIWFWLTRTGMETEPAILIAAALSFSSTVLVFKALSEWGHSALPHGRRAIGILLFQDGALVPLLLLVPLLTGAEEEVPPSTYLILAATSVLFVLGIIGLKYLLAEWIIPLLARYRSPELVVLFTVVSLGGVTLGAYTVGLPPAVGAFAAGLIFSANRWTKQIDALVLPFRETFSAIFFVSLGLLFDPALLSDDPLGMLTLLLALVALKGFAATTALRLTGLPWRASAGMGIGLAHVGEFAFVLVLLGNDADLLSQETYEQLVAVAVGSLVITPFLLKTGLRWMGAVGEQEGNRPSEEHLQGGGQLAVVIGAGPIGRQVASRLEIIGMDVCLIDLSPINLHPFAQEGFRTVAGDATLPATLKLALTDQAYLVVVCVPADDVAVQVVRKVREINPQARILVRCRYQVNAGKLRGVGAERVVSEEIEATSALLKILVTGSAPARAGE